MTFIDSHTHLYAEEFMLEEQPRHPKKGVVLPPPAPTPEGGADAVKNAIAAGVTMMVFPANSIPEIAPMKALAERFPDNVRMAMGVHPTELGDNPAEALDIVERELRDNPEKYVAVGEIGLDFYWEPYDREAQSKAFERQCRLALELDLPIIIHCREALPAILEILDQLPAIPRGVFHSFSGTVEDIREIRRRGDFYFGINGIVTFKNSSIPAILPEIGIDRILLETDSPYLAPVPFRGGRNQSAYIPAIAEAVAKALNLPLEKVAEITTASTRSLFNF